MRVLRSGQTLPLETPAELRLEDGTALRVDASLPPDLPLGYHTLSTLDGQPVLYLIVSPSQCYLPPGWHTWGWAVQLYALRSAESWGIGDLADLRSLGRWSATDLRAGILLINPLHAATPTLPQQASPYFPSSRRFRNVLYLRIEEVPVLPRLESNSSPWWPRACLNRQRYIDRDAIFRLKMQALGRLWSRFGGDPAFDRYCHEQGDALRQFAIFCALAEHYSQGWQAWPAEYRRPDAPVVAKFRGRTCRPRPVPSVAAVAPRRAAGTGSRRAAGDARPPHWRRSERRRCLGLAGRARHRSDGGRTSGQVQHPGAGLGTTALHPA